jgi:hypothetical protein
MPDSGYFCFVDDDDVVVNDSLRLCVEALDATGAGCAFTAQMLVDVNGNRDPQRYRDDSPIQIRPVDYFEATVHPQVIHHLCVMRREAIDLDACLALFDQYKTGAEWIMKISSMWKYSAVQVPIIGYHWRMHENNHHKEASFRDPYVGRIRRLGTDLSHFQQHRGRIPQYLPN